MIVISKNNFKTITGTDLDHFLSHVFQGDSWGTFLKIASTIEGSAKRSVGIKLGIDPSHDGAARLEFYSALLLCHEAGLISNEAFEFANYIRHVRNDLVHNGGLLDLDVEKLRGSSFFAKYRLRVESFATIEGQAITTSQQQHLNILLVGCIAFVGLLSRALFGDNWFAEAITGEAPGNAA